MSGLLPRKYNNPVTIGLGVVLIVAVIVIFLLMTKSSSTPDSSHQESQHQPETDDSPPKETYIPSGKPAVVLFYGDWCGWSKKILPAWEKVKQALDATGQIEALDFEDNRDKAEIIKAAELPGFRGFPDIRFYPQGYPNGEPIVYSGDRSEESILKFAYTGGQQA